MIYNSVDSLLDEKVEEQRLGLSDDEWVTVQSGDKGRETGPTACRNSEKKLHSECE